jgi:hypothetical protein
MGDTSPEAAAALLASLDPGDVGRRPWVAEVVRLRALLGSPWVRVVNGPHEAATLPDRTVLRFNDGDVCELGTYGDLLERERYLHYMGQQTSPPLDAEWLQWPATVLWNPDQATNGCTCIPHDQYAGGGHTERLVEYDPACPVHSEHVYNPRTGVWQFADPAKNARWEADRASADVPF